MAYVTRLHVMELYQGSGFFPHLGKVHLVLTPASCISVKHLESAALPSMLSMLVLKAIKLQTAVSCFVVL